MTAYLLDTNILSLLAPGRSASSDGLSKFIAEHGRDGRLFVSVIAIAEIRRGILNLRRKNNDTKAAQLQVWLDGLVSEFSDRILPVDLAVALVTAELDDSLRASGLNPGLPDILIAATAKVHGLKVVTENLRHFRIMDVEIADIPA